MHFVVCNSFTYDRIEFNFFAKDVKYVYFIEYLDFNTQQYLCRGFFENMKFSLCPPGGLKIEDFMIFLHFSFVPMVFSKSKIVRRTRFSRF